MALHPMRRRFTVSEYHQMAQGGILGEDDRVELIDGEVIAMTPIGHRHAACVNRLTKLLVDALGDVAVVSVQNPIVLGDYSEPQPDMAILHPRLDFYAAELPTTKDIYLLIEIAETSARLDRRVKVPLYARGGIEELWLVDLEQDTITVYRDPTQRSYRSAQPVHRGEQLAPKAFPDRSLPADAILG